MASWVDQHCSWTCLFNLQIVLLCSMSHSRWYQTLSWCRGLWRRGKSIPMTVSVYKHSSHHQACSTNIFDNLSCLNKFKLVHELMMNSTAILRLAWKMSLWEMCSNGGMNNIQSIHNFHAWCLIIWPSLVHSIFLFICHANVPVATSVDMEWLFSKGHMVLLYLCNHPSAQSTHALLCLGQWSKLGLVKDNVLCNVTSGELELDQDDVKLSEGWDNT